MAASTQIDQLCAADGWLTRPPEAAPIGGYLRGLGWWRERNVTGAAGRWLGWRGAFARAGCRAAGSGLSTRPLARPPDGTALWGFNSVLWGFNSVSRSPGAAAAVRGPGKPCRRPRERAWHPGKLTASPRAPGRRAPGQRRRRHDRGPGQQEGGPGAGSRSPARAEGARRIRARAVAGQGISAAARGAASPSPPGRAASPALRPGRRNRLDAGRSVPAMVDA